MKKWTRKEIDLLEKGIEKFDSLDWKSIASFVGTREPESCRRKWNRLQYKRDKVRHPAILPCPFCGKLPYFAENNEGHFYIQCNNSHCPVEVIISDDNMDLAISGWNSRSKNEIIYEETEQTSGFFYDPQQNCVSKHIPYVPTEKAIRKILPRVYVAGAYGGDFNNMLRHIRVMVELSKIETITLYSWSWMAVWNDYCIEQSQISEESAIEINMRELSQCDAIFIGAGESLNFSKGTQKEIDEAIRTGKPVFTCIDSLIDWSR